MRTPATVALLLASLILLFFIVRGSLKKESIAFLVICFVVCIGSSTTLLVSGSEFNFELYGFKFNYKTPSELEKITGNKDPILTVTSSGTGSGSVSLRASSTERIPDSAIHFLKGENFIVSKQQSPDGKGWTFDATVPPGQKIQITAPPQVTMLPTDYQSLIDQILKSQSPNQILNPQSPLKAENTPKQVKP
jgi:hypothetical protein